MRLALELEHNQLEQELAWRRENPHARLLAHEVQWRIVENDDSPRASPVQAKTSLQLPPCFEGSQSMGHPRGVRFSETSTRCSTTRQSSRSKARCLNNASGTPANVRPWSSTAKMRQSTRPRTKREDASQPQYGAPRPQPRCARHSKRPLVRGGRAMGGVELSLQPLPWQTLRQRGGKELKACSAGSPSIQPSHP